MTGEWPKSSMSKPSLSSHCLYWRGLWDYLKILSPPISERKPLKHAAGPPTLLQKGKLLSWVWWEQAAHTLCKAALHLEQKLILPALENTVVPTRQTSKPFGFQTSKETRTQQHCFQGIYCKALPWHRQVSWGWSTPFLSVSVGQSATPGIQSETETSSLCISFALLKLSNFYSFVCPHITLWRSVTVVVMGFGTVSIFRCSSKALLLPQSASRVGWEVPDE